jgi:ribosomal protein L3 glutamine methyltransferase
MTLPKYESSAIINELLTLRDLLRWGITQFNKANIYYGHGTDNAWDEALYLSLFALHLPPDVNPQILDAKLLRSERKAIVDLISRRVDEQIPAAYLTQQAWFAGKPFYVDERVVIPRSPIAELINNRLQPWIDPAAVEHILDLCTGSGCIAIAAALNFPEAHVDAVDISHSALEVAGINVDRYLLQDRVRLIESDLFAGISGKIYDVMLSNPPYVSEQEYAALPREYHYEPRVGLAAGEKGLDIVLRILQQAGKHLSPQGVLIVEVGNTEEIIIEKFPQIPFTWLEFEKGGGGVFLLTADQLEMYQGVFR